MIDLALFIPACFALNLAFGPNNLMALTNGMQHGVSFAVTAGLGRLVSFIPMIAITAIDLGVILAASPIAFTAIKLIGAAYLIWIGWQTLKSAKSISLTGAQKPDANLRATFIKEMLVASSNPKAILIFAAFFPQFVMGDAYAQSYLILGGLFLTLELLAIIIYASVGAIAARGAASKLHRFQYASGMGMILFGGLLLLTKRPQ